MNQITHAAILMGSHDSGNGSDSSGKTALTKAAQAQTATATQTVETTGTATAIHLAKGQTEARTVRPLTRIHQKDGTPYTREKSVERQINELVGMRPRARRDALLGQTWQEETLVYFVRECRQEGDDRTAWAMLEQLIERVASHSRREMNRWRLTMEDMAEVLLELADVMRHALVSNEPKHEFWEVRFWVCVDRRLQNLLAARQHTRDRELLGSESGSDGDIDEGRGEGIFRAMADPRSGPATLHEARTALQLLDEREFKAVYLRYVEDIPEESEDAERMTIGKLMGVSGRTVRNYLTRARRKLEGWQNDAP